MIRPKIHGPFRRRLSPARGLSITAVLCWAAFAWLTIYILESC